MTRSKIIRGTLPAPRSSSRPNGTDSVFLTISGRFAGKGGSCVLISTGTYIVTGGTVLFANATGSGTSTTIFRYQCTGAATGTIWEPSPSRTQAKVGPWPAQVGLGGPVPARRQPTPLVAQARLPHRARVSGRRVWHPGQLLHYRCGQGPLYAASANQARRVIRCF